METGPEAEREPKTRRARFPNVPVFLLRLRVLLVQTLAAAGRLADARQEASIAFELQAATGMLVSAQEEGLDIAAWASGAAMASSAVPSPSTRKPAIGLLLSEREIEVVRRMVQGMSNRVIAQQLFISEATVKFHLRNVNQKLGARNRTEAAYICKTHGWFGDQS